MWNNIKRHREDRSTHTQQRQQQKNERCIQIGEQHCVVCIPGELGIEKPIFARAVSGRRRDTHRKLNVYIHRSVLIEHRNVLHIYEGMSTNPYNKMRNDDCSLLSRAMAELRMKKKLLQSKCDETKISLGVCVCVYSAVRDSSLFVQMQLGTW